MFCSAYWLSCSACNGTGTGLVSGTFFEGARLTARDIFDGGNSGRRRCRDPGVFTGEEERFSEWLVSVEEARRTLRPEDPVGYVA